MTHCLKPKFLAPYLLLILCVEAALQSTRAADYYFRPTNIAMADRWIDDLSFVVSNPSKVPVVLKLTTRQVGVQQALFLNLPKALHLATTTLVINPGEQKEINLEYSPKEYHRPHSSYAVVVEQLPILYVLPGSKYKPSTMVVTRYTADIEIRENGVSQRQFAINDFGRKSEIKNRITASAQIAP